MVRGFSSKSRMPSKKVKKVVEAVQPAATSQALFIHCPDCRAKINLEGGELGDYFECDTCFAELILSELDPPRVEMVEEEK